MLDLAEEWKKMDCARRTPDSVDHWNQRSRTYAKGASDGYVQAFIQNMDVSNSSIILDMGCGTGSLALPLARLGHGVIAADFSEGMLERVVEAAQKQNISLVLPSMTSQGNVDIPTTGGFIMPLSLSWEDQWSACGLYEGCVDVAIASRSIITHDLKDSLQKLSWSARSKVCVTVGTGVSPRVDPIVAQAMGIVLEKHNDALFVFGIAADLGYEPHVRYIHSSRTRQYASRDEAYHALLSLLDYVDDHASQIEPDIAAQRLGEWLSVHLIYDEQAGCWHLDKPHIVPWAFVSWDTKKPQLG